MDDNDDAGYIRIPTKLFVSSIGSVALVSAGFTAPSDQHQISSNSRPLKTICQKFESNSARSTKTTRSSGSRQGAGGEAIVTFSQQSQTIASSSSTTRPSAGHRRSRTNTSASRPHAMSHRSVG